MGNEILFDCPEIKFIKDKDRSEIDICPIVKTEKDKKVTEYIAIRLRGETGVYLIVIEGKVDKDGKKETKETVKHFPEERILKQTLDGNSIYGITGEGGITWRSQHYKMLKS